MRDSLTDGRITIRKFRQRDVFPLYEAIHSSVTELYPYLPWYSQFLDGIYNFLMVFTLVFTIFGPVLTTSLEVCTLVLTMVLTAI